MTSMIPSTRVGSRPRLLIIDTAWLALCGVAWQAGLLDALIHGSEITLGLLGFLAIPFLYGQVLAWQRDFEQADRVAQTLPKLGLLCLGLTAMYFGYHADFGSAAGKSAFTREVVMAIGPNIAAVAGLVWIETAIWSMTTGNREGP